MGDDYRQRREGADAYLGDQLEAVAGLLGCGVEDVRLATDGEDVDGVDCYGPNGERIGLRVRDPKYIDSGDFAVRLTRDREGRNELDKWKTGAVDFVFYSYGTGGKLTGWKWLDAAVFVRAAASGFDGVRCRIIPGWGVEVFGFDSFADYGKLVVAEWRTP